MKEKIIDTIKYTDPFSESAKEIAKRFDIATDEKNTTEIENLLEEAQILSEHENSVSQASLFYSIGTTYSDFAHLKGLTREESIQKQLYFLRKSIKLIEKEEYTDEQYRPFILSFKEVLFTNYANTLDECGRKIAAIEQYKKALALNKEFGMALGNLGRVYMHYGMLEYDPGHRDLFHYFAYRYLKSAIASKDPNTYQAAKKSFKPHLKSTHQNTSRMS